MFKHVSNKPVFADVEKEILSLWQEQGTFEKSLEARKGAEEFVFYDGPPFATGLPHYGHLLAGTIKDIIPRYQTMRGKYVDRRFGWDCHGLPIEYEVEQALEINGKTEIEDLGVDVFNEKCRSIVLRYTKEWRQTVTRMGRWVDFDDDYKTMDPSYMESIWWVFKSLWDKELIYEGKKILPYCPRCSTPLSNFEANQGYMDVTDPAVTVRFAVEGETNTYILAWTTTPWTLPSNMALAVGSDITYVKIKDGEDSYYMARDLVGRYYKTEEDYDSLVELPGSELVGKSYEPLFPYFADKKTEGAFRVVAADFVSTEDGTGVVHIAPGFGEDDYQVGQAEGIPAVCPVDAEGRFTSEVIEYAGREVKETDEDIIKRLKIESKLIRKTKITHSYPHCWRCDTPLIYRAVATWFVRVEKIKDRMIEANKQIHWVPEHLKDGRFGKWLAGARDWAISRNRYWGTPLPVWVSDDGKEHVCIGSIEELEELSGQKVDDLHKHFVDDIEIPSPSGRGTLKRIPEVLDCWFESGAMPYAQAHYPFENKEHFEAHFPADFIAEGLDQTRGWFYTLMVLSVALFDKPAFKNVIVNGLMLAEDGKKMSKRHKNYPDPMLMIDTYGADALRLYMIYSPVVRAESLCFSEDGIKQIMRQIIIPLWNSYSFFVTYANIDEWEVPEDKSPASSNVLDRWILSSLESLTEDVTSSMDAYDLQRSVRPVVEFIGDLTNWYIRRSRRRFWKSQDDDDKAQAYETLHHVLLELSQILAPFIPMISESIYPNLKAPGMPESVHLCNFPVTDGSMRDLTLESHMRQVMMVVKLGRLLRAEHELKVRQPLAVLHVVSSFSDVLDAVRNYEDIILEELNVRAIEFDDNETELVDYSAKANFRRLGPRFGQKVKEIAAVAAALPAETLKELAIGNSVKVDFEGAEVELEAEDVVIERSPKKGLVVASEDNIVVALVTSLSEDLVSEGLARELVNKVQNMRKTAELDVAKRITTVFSSGPEVRAAIEKHVEYVKDETLSTACSFEPEADDAAVEWDLNGHKCFIVIQ